MTTTIIGTEATHRSGIGDFGATRESKLRLESDPFQIQEVLHGRVNLHHAKDDVDTK